MMGRKKKNIKTKQKGVFMPSLLWAVTLIVVIPLIHVKSVLDPVLYPRFTAWSVSLLLLIVVLWIYRKSFSFDLQYFKSGFFYAFLSFILISILSLFFAINPMEGLTDIFKWLLFGISFFMVVNLLKNPESTLEIIFKAVIINAVLAILIGFYQYFTKVIGNPDPNAIYEMKGLMAHKNQYSISLYLLLPFLLSAHFFLKKSWKKLNVVVFVFVILIIIMLQTRAVWIALFLAGILSALFIFVSFWKNGMITVNTNRVKMIVIPAASIFVLFIVFLFAFPAIGFVKTISTRISSIFDLGFSSNEWRLQMWDATYRLFQDNKIFGVGAGNWKIAIYPYYSEYMPSVFKHWRNPHNDFLGIAAEKGIFGLLAFVAMFVMLIYYAIRVIFKSKKKNDILLGSFLLFGLLGFLVISFFSFPAERMNQLIFVALIVAILVSKYFQLELQKAQTRKINFYFIFAPLAILLYFSIHLGIVNLNMEKQMVKVFVLKDKKEWNKMEKYVDRAYSKFASLEPNHTLPVILYKGLAKFEQQEYEKSLVYFKEAYYSHPNSVSVLNNLGSAYGQLNKIDSSIVYQRKSLEIFPHYERGLTNLAKSFYFNGEFEKAYQIILRCDPESETKEVGQIRRVVEQKLLK
jgi:O-antigen ligase